MTSTFPMEAIVARLEEQIAHHRERESFHAEQGAYHGEQQALHAAELATLTATLEAFKTSATRAAELASRNFVPPALEAAAAPSLDISRKPSLTRMVQRVIESRPPGEAFGTNAVTAEINHRYGDRLRRPVKPKLVSIALRRMAATGQIRTLREGRPHHEALYARA
ncbi:MAG TPA: hypothetical protein VHC97_26915 [Thermoanaerobaculia bacterium]|jgi:hypothetical protein|nr:hypothetical protein [Thermoanaerobaculia bacterium]